MISLSSTRLRIWGVAEARFFRCNGCWPERRAFLRGRSRPANFPGSHFRGKRWGLDVPRPFPYAAHQLSHITSDPTFMPTDCFRRQSLTWMETQRDGVARYRCSTDLRRWLRLVKMPITNASSWANGSRTRLQEVGAQQVRVGVLRTFRCGTETRSECREGCGVRAPLN